MVSTVFLRHRETRPDWRRRYAGSATNPICAQTSQVLRGSAAPSSLRSDRPGSCSRSTKKLSPCPGLFEVSYTHCYDTPESETRCLGLRDRGRCPWKLRFPDRPASTGADYAHIMFFAGMTRC